MPVPLAMAEWPWCGGGSDGNGVRRGSCGRFGMTQSTRESEPHTPTRPLTPHTLPALSPRLLSNAPLLSTPLDCAHRSFGQPAGSGTRI